ncbi:hypothetical protein KSP40_PGU009722 [Platanthera guangdongensis]|uniref:DUF4005 domain-containing protein n=1 Tax=Platanthera guangdongensis TaxID=2320717 RepID=A0ABR2M2Z5_9ASPA
MGRATRWLRSLFGGKKNGKEHKGSTASAVPDERREKRRWSFKSARDSGEPAALGSGGSTWLKSLYAETEKEQSKHAIAVAAATAAAADAAVTAAQAAVAVLQLTSHGRSGKPGGFPEWLAAVKIQRVFRGYLAKKALRALRALVKLQALVRGYLVRKQAAATFHSMQALIKAQATIRAQKCRAFLSSNKNSSLQGATSFHGRRLSSGGVDNPGRPKIVQIDSCHPNSRSSQRASHSLLDHSDEIFPNSISSPLPNLGRISLPDRRFPIDKCRYSSTAQSTPRGFAPSTPVKSVCGMTEGHFRKRLINSIDYPNYMTSTRSFEAKVRSQSAPKQRPEDPGSSKRLPLSELVMEQSRASLSGMRMRKMEEEFSFKKAVLGRLDRCLELNRDAERDFYLQKKW